MAAGATRTATAVEDTTAGAAYHDRGWHQIDWCMVQREVRRPQIRIMQARQGGRPGKVKALQRLLTHSFSGKALAVRRVAVGALRQRGYRPRPLRRTSISKANGTMRPPGIPSYRPYCISSQGTSG